MSDPDPLPPDPAAPPLLPLPVPVWLALLALGGIELAFWLGAQGLTGDPLALGWRLAAAERFGFSAPVQAWMLEARQLPLHHLWRYLSYPLVHHGPLHAVLSAVFIAALGKAVAGTHGALVLSALLILPGALGAVLFGLFAPPPGWLMGATPAVFALVGAWTWNRWHAADDPRARWAAFGLIGSFLVARLALALLVETGAIWLAEMTAFFCGAAMAAILAPGNVQRLLARLRQR